MLISQLIIQFGWHNYISDAYKSERVLTSKSGDTLSYELALFVLDCRRNMSYNIECHIDFVYHDFVKLVNMNVNDASTPLLAGPGPRTMQWATIIHRHLPYKKLNEILYRLLWFVLFFRCSSIEWFWFGLRYLGLKVLKDGLIVIKQGSHIKMIHPYLLPYSLINYGFMISFK